MVVSTKKIQDHIDKWSKKIPGKKSLWPTFLFHAADAKVIPSILSSRKLIPRSSQVGLMVHDVASPVVIDNNRASHDYCRFYFRPKTLFHVITEGIRCLDDAEWQKDQKNQMSIPIILCFDLRKILSMEEASFTKKKFACLNAERGNDDAFFEEIDFNSVYHDSPTRNRTVRDARMPEVLVKGPVNIEGNLRYIFCRTQYDKITLMSMLSAEHKQEFSSLIKVESVPEILFVHSFALFISELKFYNKSLFIKLKHPQNDKLISYKIKIFQKKDGKSIVEKNQVVGRTADFLIISGFEDEKNCTWEIYLEEVLAFMGDIPSQKSEIV